MNRATVMHDKNFHVLLALVSAAFAWVLWPFWGAVFWGTILAIIFSLVLAVMATSSSQSWLLGVAGGWMLTACAMFVLDSPIDRYVIMTASTVCFMTAPGLVLLRAERRAQPKMRTT